MSARLAITITRVFPLLPAACHLPPVSFDSIVKSVFCLSTIQFINTLSAGLTVVPFSIKFRQRVSGSLLYSFDLSDTKFTSQHLSVRLV
jgi:hypothetical protein